MSGYLFNMATIFEDFVTVALREALKSYGGRTSLQHVTHLDDDADVPVRPDFVWLTQGHPRIVVDAKYKHLQGITVNGGAAYYMDGTRMDRWVYSTPTAPRQTVTDFAALRSQEKSTL